MSSRLIGILACLVVANVLNYALSTWLDGQVARWAPEAAVVDGSSLNTARYYEERDDTVLAGTASQEALLDFYTFLDRGGNRYYAEWRTAAAALPAGQTEFTDRALAVAATTNAVKYLSILLALIALLLLFGGGLKENYWSTPLLYWGLTVATAALYGGLSAPLFTAGCALLFAVYYGMIRVSVPIYHAEWSRLMRPGLTWLLFLLGTMALRGHELLDFWFWTSPLYRLLGLTVLLFSALFHLSILTKVLRAAELDVTSRVFAYGVPLGATALAGGLLLLLYGDATNNALVALNRELVLLPPQTVAGFDPNAPVVFAIAGVLLLITGAIGYLIRRISR